jgi:hypothetical protein
MDVDAMLCNHAEAVNNQLYISGGGIEIGFVPPGAAPPYVVNVGIGILLTVPWGGTNQQHQLEVELLTEDGQPVQIQTGPETHENLKVQMAFNVGRPAGVTVGDDQHVCLAANLPGLPLPAFSKYEFVIRIDGHDERRLAYRLVPMQGAQAFGPGMPGAAA